MNGSEQQTERVTRGERDTDWFGLFIVAISVGVWIITGYILLSHFLGVVL